MSIKFICPVCKTAYTVDDADAGKKDSCKKCGQRLQVPNPQRLKTILGDEVPREPSTGEPTKVVHWSMAPPPPTLSASTPPKPAPEPKPAPPPKREPQPERPDEPLSPRETDDEPRYPRRDRPRPRRRRMPVVKLLMLIATGLWVFAMPGLCCFSYMMETAGTKQLGGGYVQLDNGDVVQESTLRGTAMFTSLSGGFCCPSVFYAITMIVLGIVYFTTKPEKVTD
ncbi:MAG TPA: hypothetical protein VHR66_26490 [Gemmataceae bacterium]|nr:hypothetical protein [Gemmataceae bacterium]